MEYRFSLTARLVALGVFGLVALMLLLFALGLVLGQRMAPVAASSAPAQAQTAPAAGAAR